MKHLFIITLLLNSLTMYSQRLNSIEIDKSSNSTSLAATALSAQNVAAAAHTAAAAAHTAAAARAAGANVTRHNDAAMAHTAAAAAASATTIPLAAATLVPATIVGATSATILPASNAAALSATANAAALDPVALAADALATSATATAATVTAAAIAAAQADNEYIIEIQGLGNIAGSQNGNSLSPSANVSAKILFLPQNKNAKLYLGYNLGVEIDSTRLDSISLGNLFLPDRSKAGYSARFEYNIAPLLKINKDPVRNAKGYLYSTELNPFIEYNYNKINIKDVKADSSRLQTSTWILGINLSHSISTTNDNLIGIQVTPYFKTVKVTAGTYETYSSIFKSTLKGINAPRNLSFFGLTMGLQVNKFIFSFDYQSLLTKSLENTPLNGGVFSIRATVIGDLIKL